MLCIKCGAQNAPGSNYCSACNALLPKLPQQAEDTSEQPRVNERYLQLKEAGDKVKGGIWTVEDYAVFLDNISRILMQKEQEIREIEIPPEAIEEFRDELEVGFAGIEMYTLGISHMKLFLEDQNPEHIDYGLDLVRDGNEKINEAMRINRDNRRKLEEMYIDSSTMM